MFVVLNEDVDTKASHIFEVSIKLIVIGICF